MAACHRKVLVAVNEPERLVTLREIPAPSRPNDELPYEEYKRLRDESGAYSGMAAMNISDRSNIAISGQDGGGVRCLAYADAPDDPR